VLALMLLQDSRRAARVGDEGEIVLLEDQDRSLWNQARIDEGVRVLDRAVSIRRPGPYQLQAAIAAAHAEDRPREEIVVLYDALAAMDSSPVVRLNRAVAVALAGDVGRGLALIDEIEVLDDYHLLHAARADLCRRLGRRDEAAAAYRRALALTANETETRYLERRLAEVS
jgi:RNA polymerase sigma-70 factor (ECF subfamily)